jgi:hypothetical protein
MAFLGGSVVAAEALPLRAILSADRAEHFVGEPIFLDAGLINVGQRPVSLNTDLFGGFSAVIVCVGADGKPVPVHGMSERQVILNPQLEGERLIKAGMSLRGWDDLEHMFDWPGPGVYRVKMVICHIDDEGKIVKNRVFAESPEVTIRIAAPPAGTEDAKAGAAVAAAKDPLYSGHALERGINDELRETVLTKTKSARYQAAARFYEIERSLRIGRNGSIVDPGEPSAREREYVMTDRVPILNKVVEGEASRYMKGIAAYRLIILRLAYDEKYTREQAAKDAEKLAKDYKDYLPGARGEEFLAVLKAAGDKPNWEIARKLEWR